MELVKNHSLNTSNTGQMQPQPYYKIGLGEFSGIENSDLHQRGPMDLGNINSEESNGISKNCGVSSSSSLSCPIITKSDGLGYHSMINAKGGYNTIANSAGSLLSFDQNETFAQSPFIKSVSNHDDYSIWEENLHSGYQNQLSPRCSNTISPNMQAARSYASTSEMPFGWLNTDANGNTDATINRPKDLDRQESCLTKRSHTGENVQAVKKHCKAATKTLKSKAKDPQSMAAKNRRERISERLKTLQDLVPNGSKVDLVTMLEKAIGYVKFLQLQVKVLATDEFWPAQRGKAPDISQVKEAIDAILASQRNKNSSSSL